MKRILFVLTLIMTALNTTFCSKQVQKEGNPLLVEATTPYGVPPFDKIRTEHFEPAYEEAMKMHNEIMAPKTGTVTQVAVTKGDSVSAGDILLVID